MRGRPAPRLTAILLLGPALGARPALAQDAAIEDRFIEDAREDAARLDSGAADAAVQDAAAATCSRIGSIGECVGDLARYCTSEGELIETDCSIDWGAAYTCGLLDCTDPGQCIGYWCVARLGEACDQWTSCDVGLAQGCLDGVCAQSQACDPSSYLAECQGAFLNTCSFTVNRFDCSAGGSEPYTCGEDSSGQAACLATAGGYCNPAWGDECAQGLTCVDGTCTAVSSGWDPHNYGARCTRDLDCGNGGLCLDVFTGAPAACYKRCSAPAECADFLFNPTVASCGVLVSGRGAVCHMASPQHGPCGDPYNAVCASTDHLCAVDALGYGSCERVCNPLRPATAYDGCRAAVPAGYCGCLDGQACSNTMIGLAVAGSDVYDGVCAAASAPGAACGYDPVTWELLLCTGAQECIGSGSLGTCQAPVVDGGAGDAATTDVSLADHGPLDAGPDELSAVDAAAADLAALDTQPDSAVGADTADLDAADLDGTPLDAADLDVALADRTPLDQESSDLAAADLSQADRDHLDALFADLPVDAAGSSGRDAAAGGTAPVSGCDCRLGTGPRVVAWLPWLLGGGLGVAWRRRRGGR